MISLKRWKQVGKALAAHCQDCGGRRLGTSELVEPLCSYCGSSNIKVTETDLDVWAFMEEENDGNI